MQKQKAQLHNRVVSFGQWQHKSWNLWDWLPGLQVAYLSSLSVVSISHVALSFKHQLTSAIIPEQNWDRDSNCEHNCCCTEVNCTNATNTPLSPLKSVCFCVCAVTLYASAVLFLSSCACMMHSQAWPVVLTSLSVCSALKGWVGQRLLLARPGCDRRCKQSRRCLPAHFFIKRQQWSLRQCNSG